MDQRRLTDLMLALHRAGGVTPDRPGPAPRGFAGTDELQDLAEISALIAGAIDGRPIDPAVLALWRELRAAWQSADAA
jgi:hypothetical protein